MMRNRFAALLLAALLTAATLPVSVLAGDDYASPFDGGAIVTPESGAYPGTPYSEPGLHVGDDDFDDPSSGYTDPSSGYTDPASGYTDPSSGYTDPSAGYSAPDPADNSVPGDAFDGESATFTGKDGSQTTVYDNGSVTTAYPDGHKEGVDYQGNQYSISADGTYSVRTTDGSVATEYPDGRRSLYEPGENKTTTFNPDGSYSEEYHKFGFTVDYDADSNQTGAGFADSDERLGYDENGVLKQGTVTGPNGQKMTVTETGMHIETADGRKIDTYSDGLKDTVDVTYPDGASAYLEQSSAWTPGADGTMQETKSIYSSTVFPDGSRIDGESKITYGADGRSASGTSVSQYTGSDGSTLWSDNMNGAMKYNDPNTGYKMIVDRNGNLTELVSDAGSFRATYDENGNLVSANAAYADGGTISRNPDGSANVTLPDGTTFTTDSAGNIWKDGVPVRQNGAWMPGYGPDAGEPAQPGDADGFDEWENEHAATDPEDGWEEAQPGDEEGFDDPGIRPTPESIESLYSLSPAAIAGTYTVSGTMQYTDYDDSEYSGTDQISGTLTVSADGENAITVSAGGDSYRCPYNSLTGMASLYEDGETYNFFFENDYGSVSLTITSAFEDEGGFYSLSLSGTRQ